MPWLETLIMIVFQAATTGYVQGIWKDCWLDDSNFVSTCAGEHGGIAKEILKESKCLVDEVYSL